jgi:hypothetical protein
MSSIADNYNNPISNLGNIVGTAEKNTGQMFTNFRNNRYVSGTSEFLYSNSLVAKVAFLLLVVLVFIFLLTLSSRFLIWAMAPSTSPFLINGMKDGTKMKHIPQDPKTKDSIPILRSNNERDGIEFTYSVWLYIKNLEPISNKKHIFNKGEGNILDSNWNEKDTKGMSFPNNGPGLYIHENKNALVVVMNTFDNVIEEVEIDNIPMNKWVNVVIRVKNRLMDVYINGTVAVRHEFASVPKQNYGDLFVNRNGGFNGEISSLRYYNRALSGVQILDVNRAGPNLKADDSMNIFPPYLSLRWYFQQ